MRLLPGVRGSWSERSRDERPRGGRPAGRVAIPRPEDVRPGALEALAEAGVVLSAAADAQPNVVVDRRGLAGVLTGRVTLRFARPPAQPQIERIGLLPIALGPARFGTETVYVVTVPDPLAFATRVSHVDVTVEAEAEVLTPIEPLEPLQFQQGPATATPAFWSDIGRLPGMHAGGVRIGIVDMGFEDNHPNLQNAWDLTDAMVASPSTPILQQGVAQDGSSSHGVACASLISGHPGNGQGVDGVAAGGTLVPITMLDLASPLVFAEVFDYLSNTVSVISGSVHLSPFANDAEIALPEAVALVEQRQVALVWAARGIPSPRADHWLGPYPAVVLVAALKADGTRQPGTLDPQCVAPGQLLPAAQNNGGFEMEVAGGGHSFAAPIVAGVIAIVQSAAGLTGLAARDVVLTTCCPPPGSTNPALPPSGNTFAEDYGAGLVNAARAQADALGQPVPACVSSS